VKLAADDMTACRQLGGAADWLAHDGLLLPSAPSTNTNLVIFPNNRSHDTLFAILGAESVD
jgi:hypothetical protein